MSSIAEQRMNEVRQRPLSLRLIVRIFGLLGRHWKFLLAGNVLVIICAITDMAIIREVKRLIDRPDLKNGSLMMLLLPLITACVLNRLSGWGQWLCTVYATNRAMLRLRKLFFERLQRLSKSFYDTHKAGWLIARNTGDLFLIDHFMTFSLMMALYFSAAILFAFREMFTVSAALLAPTALIVPVVALVTIWYQRRMSSAQRHARDMNSRMVANLSENVKGVRVVHAFLRQERNMASFARINGASSNAEIRVSRLNALFLPSIDFLGVFNTAIVVAFALLLMRGALPFLPKVALSTGDLVAYISYMNIVIWPIRMLIEMYSMAMSAMAAAERIFEIIDLEPEVGDPPNPAPLRITRGTIAFENVWFRYNADCPWTVKELSLTIPGGSTVALVGETGAGKTTLSNLIARFYNIDRGRILVDGLDIAQCSQEELHQTMAIVLQEGYLFSGTVMDNLRFRAEGLRDDDIIVLARDLGVHEAISSLADGYYTEVKEGGSSLSQGQRQIVSLTRALAADPKILILDEPTSSMDVWTERVIQRALERLIRGRTTIIIAHRLSTIRNADQILVIGNGGVLEKGPHHRLLERKGKYAQLVGAC